MSGTVERTCSLRQSPAHCPTCLANIPVLLGRFGKLWVLTLLRISRFLMCAPLEGKQKNAVCVWSARWLFILMEKPASFIFLLRGQHGLLPGGCPGPRYSYERAFLKPGHYRHTMCLNAQEARWVARVRLRNQRAGSLFLDTATVKELLTNVLHLLLELAGVYGQTLVHKELFLFSWAKDFHLN